MMKLTFNEAIANHRKMWNWIADETEKRKRIITKYIYFKENDIKECNHLCFCCQYTVDNREFARNMAEIRDCRLCPIDWGVMIGSYDKYQCFDHNTSYDWWCEACDADDWQFAAKYARHIANLPMIQE